MDFESIKTESTLFTTSPYEYAIFDIISAFFLSSSSTPKSR